MKILKAIGSFMKAQDRKAAEAIEDANIVDFAKSDLESMKTELQKCVKNLGQIKGTIMTYEEEIKDLKKEEKDKTAKAEQLLEAGNEDLAGKVCASVETIESEVEAKAQALKMQKDLYEKQQANKDALQGNIQSAESELRLMKTMDDVTKSNESISTVNLAGAQSASDRFSEKRKKMQQKMNSSTAMAEEASAAGSGALDNEVDKALGNSKGSDLLAKLKAKKAS